MRYSTESVCMIVNNNYRNQQHWWGGSHTCYQQWVWRFRSLMGSITVKMKPKVVLNADGSGKPIKTYLHCISIQRRLSNQTNLQIRQSNIKAAIVKRRTRSTFKKHKYYNYYKLKSTVYLRRYRFPKRTFPTLPTQNMLKSQKNRQHSILPTHGMQRPAHHPPPPTLTAKAILSVVIYYWMQRRDQI